jgi:hypothetical protein
MSRVESERYGRLESSTTHTESIEASPLIAGAVGRIHVTGELSFGNSIGHAASMRLQCTFGLPEPETAIF